jgi:hypothetical protein
MTYSLRGRDTSEASILRSRRRGPQSVGDTRDGAVEEEACQAQRGCESNISQGIGWIYQNILK